MGRSATGIREIIERGGEKYRKKKNSILLHRNNQYQKFMSEFYTIIYQDRQEFSLVCIQNGDL